MKKIITLLLAAALFLSTLTGCTKASENNADSTTAQTHESTATTTRSSNTDPTPEQASPVSDFEYEENGEGGITILKYIGHSEVVVIPNEIHGKNVTKINNLCFSMNDDIYSVSIPDSVIEIGGGGFFQCRNLKKVTLSSQIEIIGSGAFEKTAISEITLPTSLKSIGMRAFADCANLKYIKIPKGLTTLNAEIFSNSGLETVVFEEGVEEIASGMFANTKIREITTPKSLKTIHHSAFVNCANLEKVTLNEGLITIDTYAFGGESKLTEIIIPQSVVNLKDDTFSSCHTLKAVKFEGNAPNEYISGNINMPEYTVYYHSEATGFTSPEWNGYETAIW